MKTKKEYVAPQLTVVTTKVEKGYASSINLIFWLAINNNNYEQLEAYDPHNTWSQGTDAFWD